jgi:hypothetical protein
MNGYLDKLDDKLDNFKVFSYLEEITHIRKSNIFILTTSVFFCIFVGLNVMIKLLSTLYLIYRSGCILYSVDKVEHKKCIIDWIGYGLFIIIELFTDYISYVIPFYHTVKMILLFWLFSEFTNGSEKIYIGYVEPYFKKYDISLMNLNDLIKRIDLSKLYNSNNKINITKIGEYLKKNVVDIGTLNLEIPIEKILEYYDKIKELKEQLEQSNTSDIQSNNIQLTNDDINDEINDIDKANDETDDEANNDIDDNIDDDIDDNIDDDIDDEANDDIDDDIDDEIDDDTIDNMNNTNVKN